MRKVWCDYLSVEQYAELYGVTIETVKRWLSRGRIRSAKKVAKQWEIPEITEMPSRKYEEVIYSWNEDKTGIMFKDISFDDYNSIYIYKDGKHMVGILRGKDSNRKQRLVITQRECEKLEVELILNENAHVGEVSDNIMYIPNKKVKLKIKHF